MFEARSTGQGSWDISPSAGLRQEETETAGRADSRAHSAARSHDYQEEGEGRSLEFSHSGAIAPIVV